MQVEARIRVIKPLSRAEPIPGLISTQARSRLFFDESHSVVNVEPDFDVLRSNRRFLKLQRRIWPR
jgi:hypothetical protein